MGNFSQIVKSKHEKSIKSDHASVPPGRLHPDEDDHVAQEGEEGAWDAREAPKLQAGHSY